MRRYTRAAPCPVCCGFATQHGSADRCHGFLSADGKFARCAVQGVQTCLKTGLFLHRISGQCSCGVEHGETTAVSRSPRDDGWLRRRERLMREIYERVVPAVGTIAEDYLRGRGITLVPPPCSLGWDPVDSAMVAAVRDVTGRCVALHRTFFTINGTITVASRKMLGPCAGAAVRFGDGDSIAVAEGIETAMSFVEIYAIPCYAALSAGGIRGLILPAHVRRIVVAADSDDDGVGRAAAAAAVERWRIEGREAYVLAAPAGKDFNDLLRERRAGVRT